MLEGLLVPGLEVADIAVSQMTLQTVLIYTARPNRACSMCLGTMASRPCASRGNDLRMMRQDIL